MDSDDALAIVGMKIRLDSGQFTGRRGFADAEDSQILLVKGDQPLFGSRPAVITQMRQLLCPRQRGLRLPANLVQLLALGDVLDLGDKIEREPIGPPDKPDIEPCPDRPAILVDIALLHLVGLAAARQEVFHLVEIRVQVVGLGDRLEVAAAQFGFAVAENPRKSLVYVDEPPVESDDGHAVSGRLESAAKALPPWFLTAVADLVAARFITACHGSQRIVGCRSWADMALRPWRGSCLGAASGAPRGC